MVNNRKKQFAFNAPVHRQVVKPQTTKTIPTALQTKNVPGLQTVPLQRRGGGVPTGGGQGPAGAGMLPISYNGNERSYICEVQIGNVSQPQPVFPFPDLQTLLNKTIISIESYSVAQVPLGVLSGSTNFSAAAQQDAFIQLNDATNTALMDRHCAVNFNPQLNNGLIRELDYRNIVWTNCKLFFSTNANLVANTIAYFMIRYLAKDPRFDS